MLRQAHAGALWHRFTLEIRRALASQARLSCKIPTEQHVIPALGARKPRELSAEIA